MPSWFVAAVAVVGLVLVVISVVAFFMFADSDSKGDHSLKLGLFTVTTRSEAGLFLAGGLLLISLVLLGPAILGPSESAAADETSQASASPAPTSADNAEQPTTPEPPPPEDTIPLPGCTATIDNPFASIREQPQPFAQEIRRVPEGTYQVVDWTVEEFAGTESRWLRLSVDGDEGWIEDTTILVQSTEGCSF